MQVVTICLIFVFGPQVDHPVSEDIERYQDLGARVVELVFQLGVRIEGVVHHGDRPDLQDRIVGDDAGDDVGQEDRDGILRFDPEMRRGRRQNGPPSPSAPRS